MGATCVTDHHVLDFLSIDFDQLSVANDVSLKLKISIYKLPLVLSGVSGLIEEMDRQTERRTYRQADKQKIVKGRGELKKERKRNPAWIAHLVGALKQGPCACSMFKVFNLMYLHILRS